MKKIFTCHACQEKCIDQNWTKAKAKQLAAGDCAILCEQCAGFNALCLAAEKRYGRRDYAARSVEHLLRRSDAMDFDHPETIIQIMQDFDRTV